MGNDIVGVSLYRLFLYCLGLRWSVVYTCTCRWATFCTNPLHYSNTEYT